MKGQPVPIRIGQRFGRLIVIRAVDPARPRGHRRVECLCECGSTKVLRFDHVAGGRTVSCGCYRKEYFSTHRMSDTPIYRAWGQMVRRCLNPGNASYARYGGRGIRVCERWLNFDAFFADMGPRPNGASIDRIDNDGDYEPGNCRWATRQQQQDNRRVTVWITVGGVTRTLNEWAALAGISRGTLYGRFRRGEQGTHLFRKPTIGRPINRQAGALDWERAQTRRAG